VQDDFFAEAGKHGKISGSHLEFIPDTVDIEDDAVA
jgi:hypothetical protein